MGGRMAAGLFFFAVVAAVAAVGYLLLGGGGEPATNPSPDGTAATPPEGTHRPAPGPDAEPPEPGIEATREGCLAFLRAHAAEGGTRRGGLTVVFPEVRMAALGALASIEGVDPAPELRRALSGDGDDGDWFESRLHAAGLLILRGDPSGAETLRAYLRTPGAEEDAEVAAVAAQAAAHLPAEEAANALRRLLVPLEEYDAEPLAEVLRAVAAVGGGSTAAELEGILADEEWEETVYGAAAGALLRLGEPAGGRICEEALGDEMDFVEDFVYGLGARGNAAALPWLRRFLAEGDAWTRVEAADAMREVGDREAIPALREALADEDGDVRAAAAIALASLGEKDRLDLVRAAAAQAKDYEVGAAAFRVLGDLRDAETRAAAASLLAEPLPSRRDARWSAGVVRRLWAARLIVILGP